MTHDLPRTFESSLAFWLVVTISWTFAGAADITAAIPQNPEANLAKTNDAEAVEQLKRQLLAEFATRLDDSQKEKIIEAFRETHDGYSADEVLLNDELQQQFQNACQSALPGLNQTEVNWGLINLRKAGKLAEIKTTERNRADVAGCKAVAEIAARQMHDRYGFSTDQIMASGELRKEFDQAAMQVDDQADLYQVRRAAFQLRKTRQLRPELITRIADWGREVTVRSAADFKREPESIPTSPGIYVFFDNSGYLYVGEADNLRRRLVQHLDESDRQSLASYLAKQGCENVTLEIHTFAEGSRIGELAVRRAYESELIRSRNPRFNIRP